MRAHIRIARPGQRIRRLVIPHRLQGRPARRLDIAVVDRQPVAGTGGKRGGHGGRGRRHFGDVAVLSRAGAAQGRSRDEPEAVAFPVHQPLVPAPADPHELADRQGVEKLVGDPDARPVRNRLGAVVPDGVETLRTLERTQRWRGLDKVDLGPEFGFQPRGAQSICHQHAAPGPELDQPDIRGPSQTLPRIHAPEPHDLAEHLADFRRRGEVAAPPERVAAGIVGAAAQRHELGKRHRAVAFDAPGKAVGQAFAHGRRASSKRPATTSGRDRSCPIVTGPRMKPRCASGSRNSSPSDRASP